MSALKQSSLDAPMSEQEYLDFEKNADIRHELIDGQVISMAGSSRQHNAIAGNVFAHCHSALKGKTCRVYSSDVKVRVSHRKNYYYPDVVVGCSVDDSNEYYLKNPCLIVEVLSSSTAKRDRTEKLLSYMNIPSLQAYLLVAQDRPEVDLFFRSPDGGWDVQWFEGLELSFQLPCVQTQLSLAEIYAGIFSALSE